MTDKNRKKVTILTGPDAGTTLEIEIETIADLMKNNHTLKIKYECGTANNYTISADPNGKFVATFIGATVPNKPE
ncbi:hypothetical protein ACNKTV_002759 [Vibrio parahaemolyticus]